MLKKILDFFSKTESLANTTETEDMERSTVYSNVTSLKADELKKIADKHLKDEEFELAEQHYKQCIELDSSQLEAYKNCGLANYYLRNLDIAMEYYEKALALKPDYAEALCNRGLVLSEYNQLEEALSDLNRSVALRPDAAIPRSNRGVILKKMNRLHEALQDFDQAIILNPDFPQAHRNRGDLLKELKNLPLALKSYERALEISPDLMDAFGLYLELKTLLCDWREYDKNLKHLEAKITSGKTVATPLLVMWHSRSAEVQKKSAEITKKAYSPPSDKITSIEQYSRHKKIRVGYFSGEFYHHAVAFLTSELFERHDKNRFELFAFSLSSVKDTVTERLQQAFDQFVDVSAKSDLEIVNLARKMEIDIAIDLGGLSGNARPVIFALRSAPIQVNYLGYPGTIGADHMDYIIADSTVIPTTHQKYYTEKVAYLPCFQVNDTKRVISDTKFDKAQLGLPKKGFIFCCFNNISKITPEVFDAWMRILKQVDGSILWMLDENEIAKANLRKEAEIRGVEGNRLVFADRMSYADHLARYRMADLFLDTLPFNAGTTASDALWAGLPVLTQIGEAFAGRMAASLLNAIQLPELITTTQEDYEALAVGLAMNPDKLAEIKQKLAENRLTTPLFDVEYFTKNIEAVYAQMYERSQAGISPDHIDTLQKTT